MATAYRAPKLSRTGEVSRGYEITSPDRTVRKRGQPLTNPRPGVVVRQAPDGATVEQNLGSAQVLQISVFLATQRDKGADYFSGEEWEAYAEYFVARGHDPSEAPRYLTRLDAVVARNVERQAKVAMESDTLRELKHKDKVRYHRMATSRRNG